MKKRVITSGFVISKPGDYHVHFREGKMLKTFVKDTALDFSRALVMPNLKEPVWNAKGVEAYRSEILSVAPRGFEPLMSIYLTQRTTPETILEAAKAGAVAAKYYPKHGTTRSGQGLMPRTLFSHDDWMEALSQAGMVLCLHAEDPEQPVMKREEAFLRSLLHEELPHRFPKLRIIIEHASTALAVQIAKSFPNVATTITAHHLTLTIDDVIGDHDCLCMPVAKTAHDRRALLEAAMSGRSDVFFGSDSAPHSRFAKDRAQGACGLYTAPVALPLLTQIFASNSRLQSLPDFVSKFGAEWYRLPESQSMIELVAEPQTVIDPCWHSDSSDIVRPFMAGKYLSWSVKYDR